MKMKCPYCNNEDTRVIDSRPAEDGNSIRRRRSCDACGKRFTTYEKVETIPLIIIKKDNNREQYDRGKIENGILRACYKRPVSAADIQKTVESVETKIFSIRNITIRSKAAVSSLLLATLPSSLASLNFFAVAGSVFSPPGPSFANHWR